MITIRLVESEYRITIVTDTIKEICLKDGEFNGYKYHTLELLGDVLILHGESKKEILAKNIRKIEIAAITLREKITEILNTDFLLIDQELLKDREREILYKLLEISTD